MSFLNPFNELKETRMYPHARSYRTTFGQKMWDTFKVFFGDLTFPETKFGRSSDRTKASVKPSDNPHFGVFDYCTGIILYPLTFLALALLVESENTLAKIIGGIFFLVFTIPRFLFAAALTLTCIPFVALAQAFFNEKGDKFKQIIESHKIQDGNTTHRLGSLLDANKTPLEEIKGTNKTFHAKTTTDKPHTFNITFFNPYSSKEKVEVVLNLRDDNHKKVYKAMLKLNIDDLQGAIERDEVSTTPSL